MGQAQCLQIWEVHEFQGLNVIDLKIGNGQGFEIREADMADFDKKILIPPLKGFVKPLNIPCFYL